MSTSISTKLVLRGKPTRNLKEMALTVMFVKEKPKQERIARENHSPLAIFVSGIKNNI
jgi:hypothetical protein